VANTSKGERNAGCIWPRTACWEPVPATAVGWHSLTFRLLKTHEECLYPLIQPTASGLHVKETSDRLGFCGGILQYTGMLHQRFDIGQGMRSTHLGEISVRREALKMSGYCQSSTLGLAPNNQPRRRFILHSSWVRRYFRQWNCMFAVWLKGEMPLVLSLHDHTWIKPVQVLLASDQCANEF